MRLVETVAICRAAIQEYTREQMPLDWGADAADVGPGTGGIRREEEGCDAHWRKTWKVYRCKEGLR